MDYRKILQKYIDHVGEEEGTDFLVYGPVKGLTVEESIALIEISMEGLPIDSWTYKTKASLIEELRNGEFDD